MVHAVGDYSVTTGKGVDRKWMFSNTSAGRTVPEVIAVAVTFEAAMWMQVTRNSSRRCSGLASRHGASVPSAALAGFVPCGHCQHAHCEPGLSREAEPVRSLMSLTEIYTYV